MVAAVRLRTLEEEFQGDLKLEWRAFMLRPRRSDPPRTLEQFRTYTRSWETCAAEEPAAGFRVWATDEGPPSHSVPAHMVAKAAALVGPEAFESIHDRLLKAYFTDNRDITSDQVLAAIWAEAELPPEGFEARRDPKLLEQIVAEHTEAIENGAGGVPAVRVGEGYGVVTGAQPLDGYRRWIERLRADSGD